jgi:hypothetical protein
MIIPALPMLPHDSSLTRLLVVPAPWGDLQLVSYVHNPLTGECTYGTLAAPRVLVFSG